MLRHDLRILAAHFLEHPLPQSAGMGHRVRLVAHQNFAAWRAVKSLIPLAILEGVAEDALDPLARVDVFLRGDLVGRALLEDAARIGVDTFGVFADHHEIQILGLNSLQRTQSHIEQPHRAYIGVEIHLEAHAEENLFGMDVRRDARITERTDKDCVEIAGKHGKAVGRNGCAITQVTVGAPIELD